MANVQFDSENEFRRPVAESNRASGIQGYLIRTGIARDVQQAQMMLLVTTVLTIIGGIAVYLLLAPDAAESPKDLDLYIRQMNSIRPPR